MSSYHGGAVALGTRANKNLIPYNDFLRTIAKKKKCLLADLNQLMQEELKKIPDVKGRAARVRHERRCHRRRPKILGRDLLGGKSTYLHFSCACKYIALTPRR